MHCDECKELISVFVDNELAPGPASDVREHLSICGDCAKVFEDLVSIIDICHSEPPAEIIPPNSRALWCRIHNLIESEIKSEPTPEPRRRRWQLSFAQLASAVLGIAVVSSALTVVGIRSYNRASVEDTTSRSAASQTTFEKIFGRLGLVETPQQARLRRIRQQQAAIEYWDRRVQMRRAQWDKNMRDAFDRNLNEINQAVNDYTLILQKDPQDDLSGEMLDSALIEKMNLLREFSEL